MNEPVSNAPYGRFQDKYEPDWETINRIYRKAVATIRSVDLEHIIFLEGDLFSTRFDQLDLPFDPNLAYSSHNYTAAGFGPGRYPGKFVLRPGKLPPAPSPNRHRQEIYGSD